MSLEWKTTFPIESFRRVGEAIAEAFRARISEAAMVAGISVLHHAQQDYEAKSKHGTGEDGIAWKELSPKTIESRVRSRSVAKGVVEERRKIAQEIRGILNGGITPRARRGQGKEVAKQEAVQRLRRKRQDLSRRLDNLVIKEMSSYQIGVDTGLQRASAAPGFNDPHGVWRLSPTDVFGQNLFEIDGGTVTIAYNRSYSEAFDAERPIFPETLPANWVSDAEDAVESWGDAIVQEVTLRN